MKEKITWQEMQKKFPNEWLLIVDYETNEHGQLKCGVILRHSPSQDIVYGPPFVDGDIAFRYTGESSFSGLRSHAESHTI